MNILEKVALKQALVQELIKEAAGNAKADAFMHAVASGSGGGGHGGQQLVRHHSGLSRTEKPALATFLAHNKNVAKSMFGRGTNPELRSVTRAAAGQGALAGAALGIGGLAAARGIRNAMRKSPGQRFAAAVKAHKGKLMGAGAAAAGLGGLAAYRKRQQD